MRLRRRRAVAAMAAALLWPALALAGDPAAAREQLKIGYQLSQEGKCTEALPHLVESLKLEVKAITLINLANCEEKVGRLGDAMGHWADARQRAQFEDAKAISEEAERRATALEPRLPKLTIMLSDAARDARASVSRDDISLGPASLGIPLPVNPGEHVIVVRAAGHADAATKLTIAEAEQKTIDVGLGPAGASTGAADAPKSSGGRTSALVYVGFGGAVVLGAVGAITGLMAVGKANDAERDCPALACRDQAALDAVDSGRTLGTVSTIAFIAVPIFAVIGVYGLVSGGKKADAKTSGGVSFDSIGGRF
jgi:hypothetical protein